MSSSPSTLDPIIESPAVSAPWALGWLAAGHFLVDTVAFSIHPLWPRLEKQYGLAEGGLLWVLLLWNVSTSLSQFFFGYWGDHFLGRWVIWGGPLLAIVCLCLVGWVTTPFGLAMLVLIGGLGIAAYHPEAAASSGSALPTNRSRAMSIFAIGGYLGQVFGPNYSGWVVDQLGPRGLIWSVAWQIPFVVMLTWSLRNTTQPPTLIKSQRGHMKSLLRNNAKVLSVILLINILRVVSAFGIPLTMAYLLKEQAASESRIGLYQSIFLAGLGLGNLVCAVGVSARLERRILEFMPIVAVPFIMIVPHVAENLQLVLLGLSGLSLGITLPVMISYGQQLLPEGQRVASSITMGVGWGIGGALATEFLSLFQWLNMPEKMFWVFAGTSVLTSLLCFMLPKTIQGNAASSS